MEGRKYDFSYTENRELSWLKFNMRVLKEASKRSVPLLERLRFVSIFTTNLDEFFMVRVGSLLDKSIMTPDKIDSKSADTPAEQLAAIYEALPEMVAAREKVYRRIMAKLRKKNVSEISFSKLRGEERDFVKNFYEFNIRPVLSPQIVDRSHPFPHLKNKTLYAVFLLAGMTKDRKKALGIIEIPDSLPKLIYLSTDETVRFVRTEEATAALSGKLFKKYTVLEKRIASVTRNADISLDDDETEDMGTKYRDEMKKLMKARDRLAPVRLEIEGEPGEISKMLMKYLGLAKNQVFFSAAPIALKWAYGLATDRKDLLYPAFRPLWPRYLRRDVPMREQIRERDILLFYPYHSMEPFMRLLGEAAEDEEAEAISITLYRVARDSEVIKHLARASERGKNVTVLVELRARFDEENNIGWAGVLEEAGCRVIYGEEDFKCHSKICLITYRRKEEVSHIIQIGTGNYNEKTSAQYTDFSVMSADRELCEDGVRFFHDMLAGNIEGTYKKLLVAPHSMKPGLIGLIDEEMAKGSSGRIVIKTNAVTERDLIDKLAEASGAGVSIDLIVRGICCLVPGVPEKTQGIHVTSIVGRFLEHSRIYSFGTGSERKTYISSADIMTRNQVRRVEIACPVESKELADFLSFYLDLELKDNQNAWRLIYPGEYVRKSAAKHEPVDAQKYFIDHEIELQPTRKPRLSLRKLISRFMKSA